MPRLQSPLGLRIKQLRNEKGWTLAEVAVRSGIHLSYISAIETARRGAGLATLRRIAKTYAASPDEADALLEELLKLKGEPVRGIRKQRSSVERNFIFMVDLVGAERVFALDQIVQILETSEHSHPEVEGWDGQGSRIVLMEGPDIFTTVKPFELWKQMKDGSVSPPNPTPSDIIWDTAGGPQRMLHWLRDRGFEFEAAAWLDADKLVLLDCTRYDSNGNPAPMPMEPWMSFANFEPERRAELLAKAYPGIKKK
jgi:transcriptional regulator with XRE-family HTH domain